MQTTLRINDDIYRRARKRAGALGISLTRFFEEAVEERLAELDKRPGGRIELPVSSASGPPIGEKELKDRINAADLEWDRSKSGRHVSP